MGAQIAGRALEPRERNKGDEGRTSSGGSSTRAPATICTARYCLPGREAAESDSVLRELMQTKRPEAPWVSAGRGVAGSGSWPSCFSYVPTGKFILIYTTDWVLQPLMIDRSFNNASSPSSSSTVGVELSQRSKVCLCTFAPLTTRQRLGFRYVAAQSISNRTHSQLKSGGCYEDQEISASRQAPQYFMTI